MPVFSTDNVYYASFKDVNGLSASTPIYADGYQVGNVKSIIYNYQKSGNVLVEFQVDNDLRVPKGSTAEIESDMMGNVKMNILLANNPRERVEPGDTIQGNMNAGLMGSVQQLVPTIAAMLPKIDSILASVNMLLADPAIKASLHNMETMSANLAVTSAGLNTLVAQANSKVPGILKENPEMKVTVTGWCDTRGSVAVNRRISRQRAQALKTWLVKRGIAASRISVVGKGSDASRTAPKARRVETTNHHQ